MSLSIDVWWKSTITKIIRNKWFGNWKYFGIGQFFFCLASMLHVAYRSKNVVESPSDPCKLGPSEHYQIVDHNALQNRWRRSDCEVWRRASRTVSFNWALDARETDGFVHGRRWMSSIENARYLRNKARVIVFVAE